MKKKFFVKIVSSIIIFMFLVNLKSLKVEAASADTPAIGQICLMAFNFVPQGWAKCDGSLVDISSNNALFSLIRNTYGGDGVSTFRLPNLKSPIPNTQYYIAMQGTYPSVDQGVEFEPILGQVELFPYNFTPRGWVRCEGQGLSIQQNAALSTILGTQFGGDGVTTFKLPDLRGTEPDKNLHYCIAIEGIYPSDIGYSNVDDLVGSINLYVPKNEYKNNIGLCDGGVLNTGNYSVLYSLIGNIYSGNSTTFGKPDLRGAVPNPKLSYYIQTQGIYPSRE
jgi:microcystin-dependent protein